MEQFSDKIRRNVEHGLDEGSVASPMDPPDAYDLPCGHGLEIPYEELARPLQILFDEHTEFLKVLDRFEGGLQAFREGGWSFDAEISKKFKEFFSFVDHHTLSHNAKEEKALFPLLKSRLLGSGECSPGLNPTTPTDVMEEEHLRVLQSAYLVFNLLGIGPKMKDGDDRATIYQLAAEQAREIIEIMKLHIFKENNVLFPLAQKLITNEEFQGIEKEMGKY